jgi:hypothetical protein
MREIIHGTILYAIIMGSCFFSKGLHKRYIFWYLLLLLGVIWGEWYFSPKLNAYEYSPRAQAQIEQFWENYYPDRGLKQKDKAAYLANADWHAKKAYEEFIACKDRCWLLPNLKDRERTKAAWGAFLLIAAANTPLAKGIAILINVMTDYGCACIDEWYDIKEMLESAQANSEMAQFYRDLASQ